MEYEFLAITMQTKNNKTLYLKSEGNSFKWTFNYNDAIWFETYPEVEKFCNSYFKKFKNWKAKEVFCKGE